MDKIEVFPFGSMSTSTLMAVTLSDGGHASITPPGNIIETVYFFLFHNTSTRIMQYFYKCA